MQFQEITREPEFMLKLSLQESIALWHMANQAVASGNQQAQVFVDALYTFAERSNSYTHYLEGEK